jgi:hypothetical protein
MMPPSVVALEALVRLEMMIEEAHVGRRRRAYECEV